MKILCTEPQLSNFQYQVRSIDTLSRAMFASREGDPMSWWTGSAGGVAVDRSQRSKAAGTVLGGVVARLSRDFSAWRPAASNIKVSIGVPKSALFVHFASLARHPCAPRTCPDQYR